MIRMKRTLMLVLAAAGLAMSQRPTSLFVERVVTPDRSRQLKVALHQNLWVLYDLPQCQLYQAWAGGVTGGSLQEADFGWFDQNAHFPHWFTAEGTNHFKEGVGEYFASWTKPADIDLYYTKWKAQPRNYKAWSVSNGSAAVAARTRYRGYALKGSEVRINFGLILADGREISVAEIPEYSNAGGKTGISRRFVFAGIPAGHSVSLKLPATGWSGPGVAGGSFTVTANGETTLTGSW